jgi:hypothetical protein
VEVAVKQSTKKQEAKVSDAANVGYGSIKVALI